MISLCSFLESLFLFAGLDHVSTRQAAGTRSIRASCCLLKGACESFGVCIIYLLQCVCSLMLQAQLRAFIPEMLKYSTGRGKPGWGKESCKPVWWPEDIPWANVRSDVRTEEQKQRVREIVIWSVINDVWREIHTWTLGLLPLIL